MHKKLSNLSKEDFESGVVLLINKEINWTSFDVVKKIKNLLKEKFSFKKIKVGHAGTLDPLATGLLVVCTGKSTKMISKIQNQKKEYTGIIKERIRIFRRNIKKIILCSIFTRQTAKASNHTYLLKIIWKI